MGEPKRARTLRLKLPKQSQVFFYALLVLMLFLTWLIFRPFVLYMIAGIFVAVLSMPIDRLWERVFGVHRTAHQRRAKRRDRLAAAATIVTLFIIITVPLVILGFALAEDAQVAAQAIQGGALDDLIDRSADIFFPNQTQEERNTTIDQVRNEIEPRIQQELSSLASSLIGAVPQFFIAITVILFVVYYILTDGRILTEYIRRAAPLPPAQVDYLLHEAKRGLHAVFVGQILTSAIQGALGGIGFLIAGVPGAVLWAVVMAILSLLPVVGAFLVWVPAVIYLILVEKTWEAVFLAAWGVIVVSQVDNFLRPKLIGDRAQIHPVFVLIGVLGGVAAFGFIGLFLGPLLVGVTLSVLRVWESDYLQPELLGDEYERRTQIFEFESEPGGPEPDAEKRTGPADVDEAEPADEADPDRQDKEDPERDDRGPTD